MATHEARHRSEATIFSSSQLLVVQQLVEGCQRTREIADNLKFKPVTVRKFKEDISDTFKTGLGRDNLAKAVTFAVLHKLARTDSLPEESRQPLGLRDVNVLTWMTMGFDKTQIAKQMEVDEKTAEEYRKSVVEKIGVKSTYAAIAWGVKEFLRRQRS